MEQLIVIKVAYDEKLALQKVIIYTVRSRRGGLITCRTLLSGVTTCYQGIPLGFLRAADRINITLTKNVGGYMPEFEPEAD